MRDLPSPGSIYPLLAWLQDKGYIKEVPVKEGGKRCYPLTDKGRVFFEEHQKIKEEFDRKLKFFAPPFFGSVWLDRRAGKIVELRGAVGRLAVALWELRSKLEKRYLEQAADEVVGVPNRTAEEVEAIAKRFGGG
ncbi:MAG: PadR family transcriptional regulator [Hadesarchaea archaeon]|nr:PadR family transcriptional regulator [Hadesarchaea archaeon]